MSKTIAWAEGTFTNMTEPFTVMLTNEAQQFATDSNRKVTSAQSYYTDIIVIQGTQERTDYTIGTITSGSGITVSKNSKRVTFSVSAGTTINADTGVIEIPITLDGQTVKKQFSWSCGKQGIQGVRGEDGSNFAWNMFTCSTLTEGNQESKANWVRSGINDFSVIGYSDEGLRFTTNSEGIEDSNGVAFAIDRKVYDLQTGDTVTFSVDVKGTIGTGKPLIQYWSTTATDSHYWARRAFGDSLKAVQKDTYTTYKVTVTLQDVHSTATTNTDYFCVGGGFNADLYVKNIKLEKGSISTPYSPNPNDLKGDTGQKGQDGTSITITSKSVTYQASSSGTTTPTGTWSNTVPTVNNGQYLWTKTTVQYSDGNKTEAYSVSYKGTNGTNGTSVTVSKTEVTYQVSTSGTTAPTGTWSTTMPTCDQGLYLWTKTYVKYSDGKDTTSYAVSYKGVDGKKFAFNMLRGTNQGSKHWETYYDSSVDGKYSVESFVDEDGTNGVKFICTEKTSRWQYVCFIDYEMIKTLKSATKYVFSCDIKTNVKNGYIKTSLCTGSASNHFADNLATKLKGDNTWEHVVWSFTTYDPLPQVNNQIVYLSSTAVANVGETYIKNLKLTEGTVDTPWAPHPEDLEGRGVSETVQYYLATSQASGVTSSTSGWSTDITTQKITADKKYLWNCYQTKYSDGTSEPISTPKVIGVYGDKGAKGDNAKNLSITPSSQYFKSTDGGKTFAPNTITIKPTIQGEISFGKWQYSIDGGVSFADVVSGQKGLTISNNVLTVSKDSSLYSDAVTMVTFRAVANDSSFYDTCSIAKLYDVTDIGDGRNLLWNSNFAKTDEAISGTTNSWGLHSRGTNLVASIDTSTKHNGFNTLKAVSTANGDKNSSNDLEWFAWGISERISDNFHTKNQNYTLSFYAKASVATDFIVRWGYDAYGTNTTRTLSTDWKRYEIKLHTATTSQSITIIFKLLTAGTVWFSEFKLEKGSSATGYSTAPEDLQTAILSTKSEISSVSSKVDKNKQAIEQRVEKTTYQQDLNLVKGDISKANEGLNKWRYEIYPKSLFASEYQGKSTMDVFAKNTNLTPSQTVLINDTDLGKNWAYGDNYIAYALTFVKFSAAKSVAITFKHDDGAHLYLNGKLVGGDETCNTGAGQSLTLSFVKGWNCLEVVLNEKSGGEHIGFGTTISTLTECKLMNCYYGTPVARQSHITNQLVQNTTDIEGVSTTVQNVMTTVGDSGNITDFKTNYTKWKQGVNGIESRVGQTYTTKDEFNNLEIGGRNLLLDSYKYTKSTPITKTDSRTDGYIHYKNLITSVELEINQQYIIQAQTDGNWGAKHDLSVQHDPSEKLVTLWLCCDKENACFDMRKGYAIFTPQYATKYWIRINQYSNDTDSYTVHVWDLKVEKGNKSTGWTPAPEDVSGQITTVQSDYKQLADRFSWVVKSGTSASNMTLTDRMLDVIAQNINLTGKVTFSSFDKSAQDKINGIDQKAGNAASAASAAQSTANNAATAASKAQSTADSANAAASKAQSSIDNLEIGGRNYIYKGRGNEKAGFFRNFNVNTDEGYAELTLTAKKTYTGADLTSGYLILPREYEVGKKVTFSFDIMYTKWDFPDGSKVSEWSIGQRYANAPSGETATGQWQGITRFRMPEPGKNGCELNKWFHFEGTITIPEQASDNVGTQTNMTFYNNTDISATMTFRMKNVKLEYGSKATDFSCSLEETDENINTIQKNVDNISVGGNNLLRHSGNFDDKKYVDYWETNGGGITLDTSTKYLGKSTLKSTVGNGLRSKIWYQVDQNKTYTYSAMVKSDAFFAGSNICPLHYWCANNETNSPSTGVTVISYEQAISKTDTWTLLKLTFKPKGKLFRPFIYVGASSAMNLNIAYMKLEEGNKPTDWTPAIEDVSQDATNKASQALTDAKNYSSSAVNWVTNNGSSTTSLNSMVKKWTDGAVSDTAQINGGWIEANTITANKIAVSDFTNYCQLDKDSAPSYGFTATDDEDGIWYTADPIKRDKEISQWFTCEDSQKLYVEYDISTTVQGKVNSSDTDNSYLHSGIMIFAADGNKKAISYIRTKDATAAADGIVTHISVTETLPTWARFFKVFLQTNGQNGSFSGVLKIRNLQVRKATTGKLIVDGAITADKINVSDLFAKNITASGTIQSNNYAESNGAATAGSKWILSDGSFKSKNLSWDASGNITAAGGQIGKYTITGSYLITGSGATASGFGGNQAFWAGSSSSNDAPFRVGYNGQLVASGATLTNAIVSGDITAIKGQIGELVLQDGTLTGSGQIIKNKTDSSGNITSTTTTDYITKISQKGLDIESTIMSSDSDTTSNRGICVSPESIHLTYDGLVSRVTPQGLNILGSDSGQVAINNLASTFYYSDEGYRTRLGIDHQGILLMCEDGNKTFKINVSGADGMDISGANVRLQNNITASRFVFYKDSFNYIESLEANNTNNIYFHSNGYYSFRVNNEGNWSNETQSVYITERGISVPGEIGLYSQEMSNYVARYYVAGSTKCTAIGNGSYNTRIYGSSVWTQKAVSTSDVRLKQDFQPLDKFEDLYMNLQPVSFKYIDGYDKSEDRYFGLKAQPTEKLFEDMGENPDDYAMFNKFGIDHEDIKERLGHDVDFDEEHGLDYTNMIALNTHMVQKTRREAAIDHREIEILKAENAELKATLQAIMTKLNMQQN